MTLALDSSGNDALLTRAVELLRRVLVEVPPAALSLDTHMRIATLVTRVPTAASAPEDPSEAPTVTERPKLHALHVDVRHFIVLERALRSPVIATTFAELHDFVLVAARAYPYAPVPSVTHVPVPPANRQSTRTIAFRRSELEELNPKLLEAGGVPVETYVLGCAFSWLKSLCARWPADADLNAYLAPPQPLVEVVHFPRKP